MARTPVLNLRVDEATKARWEAAARDAGYLLSEYVRAAVEDRVAADGAPPVRKRPAKKTAGRSQESGSPVPARSRTAMCEHRRPPTAYCARCDG